MNPGVVAEAFGVLLEKGRSGDVMALWKDCPPYIIPDTSMGIFIAFTTCAMAFRFIPGFLTPKTLRAWPHMLIVGVAMMVLPWILYGQLMGLLGYF